MASMGLRWAFGTLLTILLGLLLSTHAYVELTHPATAIDAFSAGIAGTIQTNDNLRAQYGELQAAAAQAPDQQFQVPGLGTSLSGAQLQTLSFDQATEQAADQVADTLYYDGSSAARTLVNSAPTGGNADLERTRADVADNLDSVELGLGIVSDETNNFAETARTFLIVAVLAVGAILFVVSPGWSRFSAPAISTLTADIPFAITFFFASRYFGPQDEPGLTANVRESLAPTVDGLFNTYLYVAAAGILLLVLGLVWRLFIVTGQFGLGAPSRPRGEQHYHEPEVAAAPRGSMRPPRPSYEPAPFFEPEAVEEAPRGAPLRRRPAPWSSLPERQPPPVFEEAEEVSPAAPESQRPGPFSSVFEKEEPERR